LLNGYRDQSSVSNPDSFPRVVLLTPGKLRRLSPRSAAYALCISNKVATDVHCIQLHQTIAETSRS
jgi:hypothetical protein